ncbi:hypothetical protein [Oceanobacillus sp. 1P07AA]|uniref:hypothetical protein n=1 Tax=Oceanobacillus sp. 1P07AA TaxID=3132293 RepID=UPI0039A57F7B
MPNVRYTISFLPNDFELLHFVEEKSKSQNFSAYIRELIKKDMAAKVDSSMEEIFEYVAKRIKEEGYIMQESSTQKEFIDEHDKEMIIDLF